MSKDHSTFLDDWLKDPEFSRWVAKVPNDSLSARCKFCKKSFTLSNMGRQALVSHASGKKHLKNVHSISTFFKPSNSSKSSSQPPAENVTKQGTIDLYVSNTQNTKAEIIWALKCVTEGYSNNSCTNINNVFQTMFPDSFIAKSFKMGPDKLRYAVNFGLAPYFKTVLEQQVKNSECISISFDESLNNVMQDSEMDIVVQYFDTSDNKVVVRYWDSSFLGHGTHLDILRHFNEATANLNPSKIFQVSMDGPSVNWKFLEKLTNERKDKDLHQLIDIGSCGLHIIHGAFKTGAEASEWNLKETLKGAFQLFYNTPARREDFESVTETSVYPLFFCATR